MSRCFPFPPPGYEKKPQSSSLHLLLKKKEKEKELKKEKKDREKKDGRERKDKDRDKERSKDKNREKKSKKEKRRDKDKKKDKEKDKKGKRDEDHRKEDEKNVDLVKPQPKKTDVAAVDVPERRPVLMGQPVVNVPVAVVPSIADDARRTRIADMDRRADEAKDKEKKHKSRDKEEKKKKDKSKEKPRDDGGVTVVTATAADRKSPLGDGALVKRGRNGFFHEDEARSHMLSRPELPLVNGLLLEDEARPHKVARSELPLVNGPFDDDVARPQKLLRSELPPANEPVHEDEGRSHKLAWPDFPLVNGLEPNLAQDSLGKPVDFNETGKPTGKQQLPLKVNGQAPPKQAPTVPENGEPARKPSRSLHPREIQLSKLLQIPKLEQGAEPVDQDWLIGRQPATTTGPKLDDEELPKVWAEPVLTGPDGVIALPYVLPF